jgi:hypothetical protein
MDKLNNVSTSKGKQMSSKYTKTLAQKPSGVFFQVESIGTLAQLPISVLGLSEDLKKILKREGVDLLGHLLLFSDKELLEVDGIGFAKKREITQTVHTFLEICEQLNSKIISDSLEGRSISMMVQAIIAIEHGKPEKAKSNIYSALEGLVSE